ncbi:MAG: DUF2213 domain-containing protein [Pseudomonadota bacterium]
MLAYDRALTSTKRLDEDGRLHVSDARISKAQVRHYRGDEIPDWQELSLDPDRIYGVLCPPDELARAAATFEGLPLLAEHMPISAREHPRGLVVGATGNDARFEAPYLIASLAIWDQAAIDLVESGARRELSCAYRYRARMSPGVFEGERYDGLMRDLRGNHVAIVGQGRAGSDVALDRALSWRKHHGRRISAVA